MLDKKVYFHESARQKFKADSLTNWNLINLSSPIGIMKNDSNLFTAYPYDDTNNDMAFAGILSAKPLLVSNVLEVSSIKDGFIYGITLPNGAKVGDYIKPVKNKFIVTTKGDGIAMVIGIGKDGYYITLGKKQSTGGGGFSLPVATADTLGGVKIPDDGKLKIDTDGNLSSETASVADNIPVGTIIHTYNPKIAIEDPTYIDILDAVTNDRTFEVSDYPELISINPSWKMKDHEAKFKVAADILDRYIRIANAPDDVGTTLEDTMQVMKGGDLMGVDCQGYTDTGGKWNGVFNYKNTSDQRAYADPLNTCAFTYGDFDNSRQCRTSDENRPKTLILYAFLKAKKGKYKLVNIESGSDYVLPTASADVLGGVKVGDNLSIEPDGRLNVVLNKDLYGDDVEILTSKTYYQGPINPAKPVYLKCFSNIVSTGDDGIDISDLNIAMIVDQSFLFSVGNSVYKTFYIRNGALPSLWGAVTFDTVLGTRLLIFNPDSLSYRCNVILEYIKK